jgi:hypothetical protein
LIKIKTILLRTVDIWLTRFLVQNGLALFATWVALATSLSFTIFLKYSMGLQELTAGTVGLCIIMVLVCAYFLSENFFFKAYHIWLLTPWFVFLMALVGSIQANWISESPTRNNIFTVALLAVSIVFASMKLFNMIFEMMCKTHVPTLESTYTPVDGEPVSS